MRGTGNTTKAIKKPLKRMDELNKSFMPKYEIKTFGRGCAKTNMVLDELGLPNIRDSLKGASHE